MFRFRRVREPNNLVFSNKISPNRHRKAERPMYWRPHRLARSRIARAR